VASLSQGKTGNDLNILSPILPNRMGQCGNTMSKGGNLTGP